MMMSMPAWSVGALCSGTVLAVLLGVFLRKSRTESRRTVLLLLNLLALVAAGLRIGLWGCTAGTFVPQTDLPLSADVICVLLGLAALLFRNRLLYHFSYYVTLPVGLLALLFPIGPEGDLPLWDPQRITYFITWTLLVVGGILVYALDLFRADTVRFFVSEGMAVALACVAYGVNRLLAPANYLYVSAPENSPLLCALWAWIPVPVLYLFPVFLAVLIFGALLSVPEWIRRGVECRQPKYITLTEYKEETRKGRPS